MSITKDEALRCEAFYPKIAAALCAKLNGTLTSLPPIHLHTVFGMTRQEYEEARLEFPAIIEQLEALQKRPPLGIKQLRGGKERFPFGRPPGSVANPGPGSVGLERLA